MQKVNHSPYPPLTLGVLDERSTKGNQIRQEEISRESQKMASYLACGYCGKTNHTEDDCWRKGRKCLICGSSDHQISNYPKKQPRGNSVQQVDRTKTETG